MCEDPKVLWQDQEDLKSLVVLSRAEILSFLEVCEKVKTFVAEVKSKEGRLSLSRKKEVNYIGFWLERRADLES